MSDSSLASFRRIAEPHNGWVGRHLKAPPPSPSPSSCRGLVVPQQIGLPGATSSLALGISRDGAPTAPLDSCAQASPPSE